MKSVYKVEVEGATTSRYLNDKLHSTDGPAIERANGSKEWYLNGERHRTDGPAIEWADGSKAWYLNGQQVMRGAVYKATYDLYKKINILRWA